MSNTDKLLQLLNKWNIQKYEITNNRYGFSVRYGELKQLIVYDRRNYKG